MSIVDDEQRYVDRRSQFLASSGVLGFREKIARAVAWSELGYTASGIATQLDVTDSTGRKYLREAAGACHGITTQTVVDTGGDPETPISEIDPPAERECPVCLAETLCSPDEAESVHRVSGWGATEMLEDADLVCAFCHAVKIDGSWQRMETVDSRAYTLSEAGNKSSADYRERLTRGIDPSVADEDRGVENPDEVDW